MKCNTFPFPFYPDQRYEEIRLEMSKAFESLHSLCNPKR